jgi:GNAT superfamily N-acetyltransferase
MKLELLSSADYEFLSSIVDEWWGNRPVRHLLQRLFLEHFGSSSYKLVEGDAIVAFLVGFRSQSQPQIAYVHFVGVHPEWRKQGLARQLYLRFFSQMTALGCTECQSITSPLNRTSIAFHTGMGFELLAGDGEVDGIPVHLHHAGEGQHRVVFRKPLD